jgi:hypothetical protein
MRYNQEDPAVRITVLAPAKAHGACESHVMRGVRGGRKTDAEDFYSRGSMHFFRRDCSEMADVERDVHCELMREAPALLTAAHLPARRIRPVDVEAICRVLRAVLSRKLGTLEVGRADS